MGPIASILSDDLESEDLDIWYLLTTKEIIPNTRQISRIMVQMGSKTIVYKWRFFPKYRAE